MENEVKIAPTIPCRCCGAHPELVFNGWRLWNSGLDKNIWFVTLPPHHPLNKYSPMPSPSIGVPGLLRFQFDKRSQAVAFLEGVLKAGVNAYWEAPLPVSAPAAPVERSKAWPGEWQGNQTTTEQR